MLEPGLTTSVTITVRDADTAVVLGSGDVPVLGTPRLIALCEAATVEMLTGRLDTGQTSVGTRVTISHLSPSSVGSDVTATAVLDDVDGHLLRFSLVVMDGSRKVAEGSIRRAVVDRQRFLDRL